MPTTKPQTIKSQAMSPTKGARAPASGTHAPTPPQPFRWTRRQFDAAIAAGVFQENPHAELIDGGIVAMSPQGSKHYASMHNVMRALEAVYAENFFVRMQGPLVLDPDSEPEPDVAVVRGSVSDYIEQHPTEALLAVEVADTSLAFDQTTKLRLYARHGIAEYWILDVQTQRLEVYRQPAGETYQTKVTLEAGETVTPPEAARAVAVGDLML